MSNNTASLQMYNDVEDHDPGEKTSLYALHKHHSARMVSFSGFSLPLHYGSVLREHLAVRESAGMFDLSHLCILDIEGEHATDWLRVMLTNDVARLSDGTGMHTCLCRENGGVIDDAVVFRLTEHHYRFYIDSARLYRDLEWLDSSIVSGVEITPVDGNAIIAVQGPDAVSSTSAALRAMDVNLPIELDQMQRFAIIRSGDWSVSRTGYTGEDGVEITLPAGQAAALWQALEAQFVIPAGLGARDILRVEAGFGAYGHDISDRYTPAECGLARTIDISDEDRMFIGREILEDHKRFGGRYFQIGLILDGPGMLKRGARVEWVGHSVGRITSGTYSPGKGASIALARVDRKFTGSCDVYVRDRLQPAHVTSIPFVPHGLARE